MDTNIARAAEIIKGSRSLIALTGAGISVESGIPDFRSAHGLWAKYDPFVYASIEMFREDPSRSWKMIFEMIDVTQNALPNPGHRALADLERMGLLKAVITQNIDNLHQEAGSTDVIEYHGNASRLECLQCGGDYDHRDFPLEGKVPPRCPSCHMILKPAVVFFGEMIPREAQSRSQSLAERADAVIVVGTSAVVYPAAGIPLVAKRNGASIIEFNVEPTELTRHVTDVFVEGPSGKTLPILVELCAG